MLTFGTLSQQTSGFVTEVSFVKDTQSVRLQARYDISVFSSDLFKRLEIHRPISIRRAVKKRQAEFLAGRVLAKHSQIALGQFPRTVGVGSDRAPIWPVGVVGSISHSDEFCACLMTLQGHGSPGIDIEAIATDQALEAILSSTVSGSENEILRKAQDLPEAATLCFSAKETLFKALYPSVGRFFGFEAAALVALPKQGKLILRLTQDLAMNLHRGHQFNVRFQTQRSHVLTWLLLA